MKNPSTLSLVSFGFLVLLAISNCNSPIEVVMTKSPAGANSSEPNMHVSKDGTVYLSWVESLEKHTTLYYSTLGEIGWSDAFKIAEGDNWFVNWADFPSVSSFGEKSLASHFLVESVGGDYSYDVGISISNDGGNTWNETFNPHQDNTATEHGFVSLVAYEPDRFLAIWLDGREYAEDSLRGTPPLNEMTLRSAVINKQGELTQEALIDSRVCSCCQTDAAITSSGPIVVYRDRSETEIRDISVARLVDGTWTAPYSMSGDEWEIAGCPVNGPAVAAHENLVAVAWYTAANESPKIKIAFSQDAGQTFNAPILVSKSNPEGRVDLILLNDGSALMSWLESSNEKTSIKARKIHQNGSMGDIILVAHSDKARSSGFPRMVERNDVVYFAWTQVGDGLSVRTSQLHLSTQH